MQEPANRKLSWFPEMPVHPWKWMWVPTVKNCVLWILICLFAANLHVKIPKMCIGLVACKSLPRHCLSCYLTRTFHDNFFSSTSSFYWGTQYVMIFVMIIFMIVCGIPYIIEHKVLSICIAFSASRDYRNNYTETN